jgi:hypothetical protein
MEKIYGIESFSLENTTVRLFLAKRGAHMAPVTFYRESSNPIQPYYVNPWNAELSNPEYPSLLQVFRGDFFCLPFGGNNVSKEFTYPSHGPTANDVWSLKEQKSDRLVLQMDFPDNLAHVEATFNLRDKQPNIYIEHRISNCSLRLPYGHHAILDCSSPLHISTSPFKFGMVTRKSDIPTEDGEYHALKGHSRFSSLKQVPSRLTDYPFFDISRFPARQGFSDVVQLVNEESDGIGWNCAVCPEKGYLWFSLKEIKTLPSTLLWMENKGRHQAPWSGRNVCIGIEDVCSCFGSGSSVSSVSNELSKEGVKTSVQFHKDEEYPIRYIEGVVRIPPNFTEVKTVSFDGERQTATFTDVAGISISTTVDSTFLLGTKQQYR